MKSLNLKLKYLAAFYGLALMSQNALAGEAITWIGTVQEKGGSHTPKHDRDHELEFVRQADKESFDIVDSPALLESHVAKDKLLLVEVEGEQTSRFLFWGGNLVVKNFKIMEELGEIAHREPARVRNENRMNRRDYK